MKHTLIIAEAGVNHNGRIDLAYKMIDAAKEAGADIIKFQTAKPHNLVSKYAEKADYQKKTTKANEIDEIIQKVFQGKIDLKKNFITLVSNDKAKFNQEKAEYGHESFIYNYVSLYKSSEA